MKIHHYHPETGAYMGEGQADESPLEPGVFLIPAHATDTAPPAVKAGKTRTYSGGAWGQVTTPTPEPEPTPPAPPTPQELQRAAIAGELAKVDAASARPARAVAVALGQGKAAPAFDVAKLQTLEAQAASLRAELAAIV